MSADVLPPMTSSPQPTRIPSSKSANAIDYQNDLSTLPDPRSRAMSPAVGADGEGDAPHHPDLNQEVATLSNKLINAINHQTNLDDTLSHTRAELDESREKIRQLETQNTQQRELLAGDVWVRRKTVESEKMMMLSRVAEEKKARQDAEQQRKKMEQELENLTAALFEEANKMVIAAKEEARKEQDVVHRKNDSLKAQLADTECLLRSQQEQLAELKQVMEQMSSDRDDQTAITAPSSPGFSKFDGKDEDRLASEGSQVGLEPISPSYPTSFTHLLQPVLRTDLAAYEDFIGLVKTAKRLSMRSRPPSGTQTSLSSLGLALGANPAPNGSNSSLSTIGTPVSALGSSPQTPNIPATAVGVGPAASAIPLPPLKETKFYKRVLAEDVEPTLRLDTAPGLSWLARRTVLNAMTEGSLVVEPVPTTGPLTHIAKPLQHPCSLCGDNRKDDEHLRRHRFRTSESESAQRYPLCKYCLGRVRSTCDFLGFLRIVKDGHWRADDEDAEKVAWEESVRLREQMFWSRIGGGVIPSGPSVHGSASSAASVKSPRIGQGEAKAAENVLQKNSSSVTVSKLAPAEAIPQDEVPVQVNGAEAPTPAPAPAEVVAPQTPPQSNRNSAQSLAPSDPEGGVKRLSLHIPGFP